MRLQHAKLATIVLLGAALVAATSTQSAAVVYTWTGAIDGDWTKPGNWDANGVPVDNHGDTGLSLVRTDSIVFSATNMPSSNIPSIGGRNATNADTPTMLFNSGGSISLAAGVGAISGMITNQFGATRTVFTIGDGVGGGTEDVTLNLTLNGALIRHDQAVTHNLLINSDGTLNFTGNFDFSSEPTAPRPRYGTMTIAGGTVNISGSVDDLTIIPQNFVDFTALGGSFTAAYGNDFANLGDVTNSLGVDFLSSSGAMLWAVDNGNNTFTVSAVPEPSTLALAAFGLLGLGFCGRRRRRRRE